MALPSLQENCSPSAEIIVKHTYITNVYKCIIHEVLRHTFASACSRADVKKDAWSYRIPANFFTPRALEVSTFGSSVVAAKKLGTTKHAKTMKNIQPPKHIQQEIQKLILPFTHPWEKSQQRDRRLFLKAKRAAEENNRTRRGQPTILVGEKLMKMPGE